MAHSHHQKGYEQHKAAPGNSQTINSSTARCLRRQVSEVSIPAVKSALQVQSQTVALGLRLWI